VAGKVSCALVAVTTPRANKAAPPNSTGKKIGEGRSIDYLTLFLTPPASAPCANLPAYGRGLPAASTVHARGQRHLDRLYAQRRSMWTRMTCRIGAEGDRVLRHRYRGSPPTMPALMETRAPPPPGSPSGPMIPEPARRSRSARSSRDTNTAAANSSPSPPRSANTCAARGQNPGQVPSSAVHDFLPGGARLLQFCHPVKLAASSRRLNHCRGGQQRWRYGSRHPGGGCSPASSFFTLSKRKGLPHLSGSCNG
jgi:hypothetical protein